MNANTKSAKDASFFHTIGALLHAAKDWTSVLENFPYRGEVVSRILCNLLLDGYRSGVLLAPHYY
jgi:hypothetical protein